MKGRRRRLKIINRPWYHWFKKIKTQTAIIVTVFVTVVSVAIAVWDLQDKGLNSSATKKSGTTLETMEKIKMELDTFIKNIDKKLTGSSNVWPNHILHSTCCLLFPAFALMMVGPRNVKRFLCLMAESFVGIYRSKNIVHGVNLFLLFVFIVIAYAYLFMFYQVCAGFLKMYIGYSVAEATHRDDLRQKNMIDFSKFQQKVAPYFTANVTRYDMEDVVMTCSLLVACEMNVPAILNSFRWVKDSRQVLEKTDKIHIITNVYKWTGDSNSYCDIFLIEAKLGLEVINSADYGKYSCKYIHSKNAEGFLHPIETIQLFEGMHSSFPHDGFTPYSLPKKTIREDRLEDVPAEIFANYYLQRKIIPVQEVNVLPGGVFIEYVPYWSLDDPGNIIINETVWGKDNEDCCWLPIWFYKFFFGHGTPVSRLKIGLGRQRFLLRQQCVCVKDFIALKNLFFTRTRYNSTSERKQAIQVHYPRHFKLALGVPNMFKIIPETDNQLPFITTQWLFLVGMVLFIPVVINVFILLKLYLICVFQCIWIPVISSLKDSFLAEHLWQGYDYDIYLSYDEEDRYELELAQELKESLGGTECSVFDAWMDLTPGHIISDEQHRAMEKTSRFCVIISEESANDGKKILEFAGIKQTLADRKAAGTKTEDCKFVIQIGDCARDGFLIPGNVEVSEYSKENNVLDDSVLRSFSKWARHLTTNVNFWQLMESHGFSIKHLAIVSITTCIIVACVFYSGAIKLYEKRCSENEKTKLFYEADD